MILFCPTGTHWLFHKQPPGSSLSPHGFPRSRGYPATDDVDYD